MGAGYVNEETPETRALVETLARYFRSEFPVPNIDMDEAEHMARGALRIVGMYREHRVEL